MVLFKRNNVKGARNMQEIHFENYDAKKIFDLMEYYGEIGPVQETILYETSVDVFDEVRLLAREDYLEHVEPEELTEEEMGTYNNPETTFYRFTIVETKKNGNIVFTT